MNVAEAISDAAVIAGRHLLHLRQTPSLMALTLAQPALFVVLFTYGFGGAIRVPGVTRYIDYLLPGIVVLAIAFGSSQTAVALAEDNVNGTTDRLRTLPIAPCVQTRPRRRRGQKESHPCLGTNRRR